MTGYLLDTTLLAAFISKRQAVVDLVRRLWVSETSVKTSILVYGEVFEYFRGLPSPEPRIDALRAQVETFRPLSITAPIVERYAVLRGLMRSPQGVGLIGDIDTLIAATALDHDLTLVTTDSDFQRVPDLAVTLLHRRTFEPVASPSI